MSFALGGSGDVVVAPPAQGAAANVLGNPLVVGWIVSFLVETLGVVTSNVVTRTPPKKLKREEITIECDAQKWGGVKCAFRPRPGDHVALRAPGNILRWFTVNGAHSIAFGIAADIPRRSFRSRNAPRPSRPKTTPRLSVSWSRAPTQISSTSRRWRSTSPATLCGRFSRSLRSRARAGRWALRIRWCPEPEC